MRTVAHNTVVFKSIFKSKDCKKTEKLQVPKYERRQAKSSLSQLYLNDLFTASSIETESKGDRSLKVNSMRLDLVETDERHCGFSLRKFLAEMLSKSLMKI
jgi:hypothetical protein